MVTGSALHRESQKAVEQGTRLAKYRTRRTGRTTPVAPRSLDFGKELSKDAGRENRRGTEGRANTTRAANPPGASGRASTQLVPSAGRPVAASHLHAVPGCTRGQRMAAAGIKPGRRFSRLASLTQPVRSKDVGSRGGRPLPLRVQDGGFPPFHPSARPYCLRSLERGGIACHPQTAISSWTR